MDDQSLGLHPGVGSHNKDKISQSVDVSAEKKRKEKEKAFDKVQHPFIIKTLSKAGIEGAFLNIIKANMRHLQPTSYSMD